jgi:hypothetical protein
MSKMKDEWFSDFYYNAELEQKMEEFDKSLRKNVEEKNYDESGTYGSNHPSGKTFDQPWNYGNQPRLKKLPDNKPVDKSSKLYPRDLDYDDEFYWNLLDTTDLLVDVMLKKHMDYGTTNISNSPGGALNGVAVRLHDKIARLANLLKTGNEPNHETIYDTLLDIANYGIIGMLVFEDKWDKGA